MLYRSEERRYARKCLKKVDPKLWATLLTYRRARLRPATKRLSLLDV
jgi:hypothetical protein